MTSTPAARSPSLSFPLLLFSLSLPLSLSQILCYEAAIFDRDTLIGAPE